jgi:diguanylate cyclase (GGDEF)-like protein
MIEAKPHPQEQQRLEAVKALNLLDTPLEERFERITRMVCRLLDMPIAIFNLIDTDRQHYKSVQGLNATNAPLGPAFCTHAILEEDMLLVPDASKDERFYDNPFVTGELLNIGFYAGCPVHTAGGMPVGTLCAIDTKPREFSPEQQTTLRDLAAMLENELKIINLSRSQQGLILELDNAQRLSLIDPLTRLWNRNGIRNIMEREWGEAVRQKKPVSIVFCDIDHFKKINDTYGHSAGDQVLQAVAKNLLEMLRIEDAVGRIGGEEFLLMLNNTSAAHALDTVERIRKSVAERTIEADGYLVSATMSFGLATDMPTAETSLDSLINKADKNLYAAKNGGRNCVRTSEAA